MIWDTNLLFTESKQIFVARHDKKLRKLHDVRVLKSLLTLSNYCKARGLMDK